MHIYLFNNYILAYRPFTENLEILDEHARKCSCLAKTKARSNKTMKQRRFLVCSKYYIVGF